MKSFKALFLLGISVLFAVSCSDKKEKMLCKRWQVVDVLFMDEKESMVQTDTMQGKQQQEIAKTILRDVLTRNMYEFHPDGTYITGNQAADATGRWKLKGNAIHFISDNKDGKEKVIPIEKLQDDTLILLMQKDQTSIKVKLIMTPLPN